MRVAVIVLVVFAATGASLAALPQTPLGPKATADEVKTYEAFRAWLTKQPLMCRKPTMRWCFSVMARSWRVKVSRKKTWQPSRRRWDLIVLIYVGAREYAANVSKSLRPGGMAVVEGLAAVKP
jgi:hypothetical protein